jgi:phosphoesterase RecJ-like protein
MTDPRAKILDILSAAKRVLITTHVRPDGDALGTSAAMALALRRKKIDSHVLLLSRLPRKYAFIYEENHIVHDDVEAGWPENYPLDDFDVLLVVDTGTWTQLPGLQERLAQWPKPKIVLDHHVTQEDWADAKLVQTDAAAAGQVAADLISLWQVPLDAPIASSLFLAIASDTGWFQYANTQPQTLRLAAQLMEAGADTQRIYELLYQNERVHRLALHTRVQQTMELLSDSRLAVMKVTRDDFDKTGAGVGDTENLINFPLQIRTVEVSILLVEPKDDGPIRASFRSKGQVNVARFAEQFGGGGHTRASGAKYKGTLQQAHDALVSAMQKSLAANPSPTP